MPQTAVEAQTCSTCPHFNDFHETNHRGWCNQFDHHVRGHHQATNDCLISSEPIASHQLEDNLALFPDVHFQESDAFPTEEPEDESDNPRSEYQVGSIVKIIDPGEHHSEWGAFKIVECRHNSHLHDTAETYLNQAEWYYRLGNFRDTNTQESKPFYPSLWIAQNDICSFDIAHNINTNDMRSGIL